MLGSDATEDGQIYAVGHLNDINTALEGLTFRPKDGYVGPASVWVISFDLGNKGGGPYSKADTININVVSPSPVPVNQPLVNTVPGDMQLTGEDAPLVFSTANGKLISVSDHDASDEEIGMRVGARNGTVSLSHVTGLTFWEGDGVNDTIMRFHGTESAINSALDGLLFQPAAGYTGWAEVQIVSTDLQYTGSGPWRGDTDKVDIRVNPGVVYEDTPLVFGSANNNQIVVSDVDAGAWQLETTLSATHGMVNLGSLSGITITGGSNGSPTVTFTGQLADINQALEGMSFNPDLNYNGPASITVTVNDPPQAQPTSATLGLMVHAINDPPEIAFGDQDLPLPENQPPVITMPAQQSTGQDISLVFSTSGENAISVADPDVGGGLVRCEVHANDGTLTLSQKTNLVFHVGDGTADHAQRFSGPLLDVNAALNGLTFNPTIGFVGTAKVWISVSDWGGSGTGGPYVDTESVDIKVIPGGPVNYPPINTVPVNQTTPVNTPLTFTGANAFSVSDPDAGDATARVYLMATHGTVALSQTTGLTIRSGDPAGDDFIWVEGPINQLNAALNGLQFTPSPDFEGWAVVSMGSNDLGNTGTGGSQGDLGKVDIAVGNPTDEPHVNQQPVIVLPGALSMSQETTRVLSGPNAISIVDDSGNGLLGVSVRTNNGTLSLSNRTDFSKLSFVEGDGFDDWHQRFGLTLSEINQALDGLVFKPSVGFVGTAQITVFVNDFGSGGTGIPLTDVKTLNIQVSPRSVVNQTPVNTVPILEQETPADTPLTFSTAAGNAISIWDQEAAAGGQDIRLSLIATNGTLDLSQATGLRFLEGTVSGDDQIVLTGTIANINAALEGLTFTPTPVYKGWANLFVGSNDLGNTGNRTSGGWDSDDHGLGDLDTISINVGDSADPDYIPKGSNSPPVNTVPGTQTAYLNTPLEFSGVNKISITDDDDGSARMAVKLIAGSGWVSLSQTNNLSFIEGDGTEDSVIFVAGITQDINAALDGLTFRPKWGYTGPAYLSIVSMDLGNQGGASQLMDADSIQINVVSPSPVPLNQLPVNVVPGEMQLTDQNAPLVFSIANGKEISVSDPDAGVGQTADWHWRPRTGP